MDIRAYGNRIVIEPVKVEKVGNIILPESCKQPNCGRIMSIGPDVKDINRPRKETEESISKGTTVYYSAFSGTEVSINDTTYVVISEDDILCKVGHFK